MRSFAHYISKHLVSFAAFILILLFLNAVVFGLKLLRSYVADLLNTGISDSYNIGIEIAPDAENAVLECDARLISRAVNNLVQNSMKHNPQGCEICLSLAASKNQLKA